MNTFSSQSSLDLTKCCFNKHIKHIFKNDENLAHHAIKVNDSVSYLYIFSINKSDINTTVEIVNFFSKIKHIIAYLS